MNGNKSPDALAYDAIINQSETLLKEFARRAISDMVDMNRDTFLDNVSLNKLSEYNHATPESLKALAKDYISDMLREFQDQVMKAIEVQPIEYRARIIPKLEDTLTFKD